MSRYTSVPVVEKHCCTGSVFQVSGEKEQTQHHNWCLNWDDVLLPSSDLLSSHPPFSYSYLSLLPHLLLLLILFSSSSYSFSSVGFSFSISSSTHCHLLVFLLHSIFLLPLSSCFLSSPPPPPALPPYLPASFTSSSSSFLLLPLDCLLMHLIVSLPLGISRCLRLHKSVNTSVVSEGAAACELGVAVAKKVASIKNWNKKRHSHWQKEKEEEERSSRSRLPELGRAELFQWWQVGLGCDWLAEEPQLFIRFNILFFPIYFLILMIYSKCIFFILFEYILFSFLFAQHTITPPTSGRAAVLHVFPLRWPGPSEVWIILARFTPLLWDSASQQINYLKPLVWTSSCSLTCVSSWLQDVSQRFQTAGPQPSVKLFVLLFVRLMALWADLEKICWSFTLQDTQLDWIISIIYEGDDDYVDYCGFILGHNFMIVGPRQVENHCWGT